MNKGSIFYDAEGTPVAYCDDGESIYLYSGEPVAYVSDDSVYTFGGRHIGFIEDGWVRDHSGMRVFCTEHSKGGPARPVCRVQPVRRVGNSRPAKKIRRSLPNKAMCQRGWSSLSGMQFFL